MQQLEKFPESMVKIRFADCDPFNHLNNSKYIDYFINAREDHVLEHYGFDIYKMAKEKGVSWVVAQNQIAYLAPANLMETVIIQTQLLNCSDKSLIVEGVMWDESKTMIKAVLWTKLVHFELRTQKSHPHSEELMTLFKQIENPLAEQVSFEQRVMDLKGLR